MVSVAVDADGNLLPQDFTNKLMMLTAHMADTTTEIAQEVNLTHNMGNAIKSLGIAVNERSKRYINEESEKISRWADDQTYALEQELRDIKRRIKEKERAFKNESDTNTGLDLQKEIQTLQRQMKQKRQALFALEDEIDERRHMLIEQIEASLNQTMAEEKLFTINWTIQ